MLCARKCSSSLAYAVNGQARPDEAIGLYQQALAIYDALGDVEGATNVRRWLAGTLIQHDRPQDALRVTTDGVAAGQEERTARYHGLVASHAMALLLTGSIAQAGPWVDKALELAFDEITTANANHVAASWHAWGGGDKSLAGEHFRRAREVLNTGGWDSTAAGIACDHAVAAYLLGQTADSEHAEEEARRLAAKTGRASTLADLHAFRSLIAVQRGAWEDAQKERSQWQNAISTLGSGTLYGQLGKRATALEQFWKHGPAGVQDQLDMGFLLNPTLLPILAVESGDVTSARNMLDLLRNVAPSTGRGLLWLGAALPIASALTTLKDQRALEWYESISAYKGCCFDWFLADLELARVSALAGRWAEAEGHFGDAATFCDRQGLKPMRAQVSFHRALMLMERRAGPDRRDARALLERARNEFEELDMTYMRRKVVDLLGRPEKGRPLSQGPSGLTPQRADGAGPPA